MDEDPSRLIAAAMWNKIGDCENTYDELIQILKKAGYIYFNKVWKGYLELNPYIIFRSMDSIV
ncbi:hypothetical protein bcgnr5391_53910 [Bacillus cereus]